MQEKHTIVVGSGISGLTMALLQAQQGRHVVLVERQAQIGGYLRRFIRNGLHYDTGFHFTGGNGGVLQQIIDALGFRQEDFRLSELTTEVNLKESGTHFRFPNQGLDAHCEEMCRSFPSYATAIRRYYDAELETVINTPLYNLDALAELNAFTGMTDYDGFTVNDYMSSLGMEDAALRTMLPIMAICHGTPPCEASFPYHCRNSYGLDSSISTIAGGGDAFLASFQRRFRELGVGVMANCQISRLKCSETAPHCEEALLSNGVALPVERIFFAVHPSEILSLFPERLLSKSIKRRLDALRPTCSCFALHGYFEDGFEAESRFSICLEKNDLDALLLPGSDSSPVFMIVSNEPDNGRPTFTVCCNMFLQDCPPCRGEQYREFKSSFAEVLLRRIYGVHPEYRGKMRVSDVSTPLTSQRYSPPIGSTYGTRQIMAQSRIAGRLPLDNCFNLGHHAQFPGIIGCTIGAMMLDRSIKE